MDVTQLADEIVAAAADVGRSWQWGATYDRLLRRKQQGDDLSRLRPVLLAAAVDLKNETPESLLWPPVPRVGNVATNDRQRRLDAFREAPADVRRHYLELLPREEYMNDQAHIVAAAARWHDERATPVELAAAVGS